MKLPFSSNAFIPEQKLQNYLLSETHPVGRFKAKFFRQLGFTAENVELLASALLHIAQTAEIKKTTASQFGTKYVIDGHIQTSNKKQSKVRTVWIIENDQKYPSFVTAYPV